MEGKTLRLFWVLAFLFGLAHSFFFATYVVFLVSKGLNLLEVNLINTFYMAGVFVLEVPTGAYADLAGRRKSFILGCFLYSFSMFFYYLSGTFWMFVFSELVGALATTFRSGAFDAWFVDSLKFHWPADMPEKILREKLMRAFKRMAQFDRVGIVIGSLVGGYVGNINLALPWLCSSIAMLALGSFCLFFTKEEYWVRKTSKLRFAPIRNIIAESVRYGVRDKAIFCIVAFGAVYSFSCMAFNMQWQILFQKRFQLNTIQLGWAFLGMSAFLFAGNELSGKFSGIFRYEKDAVVASQIVTVCGIALTLFFSGACFVMVSFLTHEIGRGIFAPLKNQYLNHRIPGEQRATLVSFDSMVSMVGTTFGLVTSGYLAKNFSIALAWTVSVAVLAVSLPIFLRMKDGE